MATRFYLTRTAFSVVNPGTQGVWGSSVKSIYKLGITNPADSSFLTSTYTGYGAGTVLFRQFITEPLAAGIAFTSTTTFTLVMRHSESSTSANAYQLYHVSIVSEDGLTTRAEFSSNEKDGTEFGTSLAARSNVNTGGLGTYTTVAGDRLVLEVGWDQDGSGSYSISHSIGNTSASDLSGEGDTGVNNAWFETSVTCTLDAGGESPPPATNEDYELTAYITGVLDEWV